MKVGIIAIVVIAALAANVWFWLRILQPQNPTLNSIEIFEQAAREKTRILCRDYEADDALLTACREVVEAVAKKLPGAVVAIGRLDASQKFVPSADRERFWTVRVSLQEPFSFERLVLEGETDFLVSPPDFAIPYEFF